MQINDEPISTYKTINTAVDFLQLNTNYVYDITHRGTDRSGAADVHDVFVLTEGGAAAGYTEGNGQGVMKSGDTIRVQNRDGIAFKSQAGNPCLTIKCLGRINQFKREMNPQI